MKINRLGGVREFLGVIVLSVTLFISKVIEIKTEDHKKSVFQQVNNLIFDYQVTRESNKIDSACLLIEKYLEFHPLTPDMVQFELYILSFGKRYDKCLNIIEDESIKKKLDRLVPNYSKTIHTRFEIMKLRQENKNKEAEQKVYILSKMVSKTIEDMHDQVETFLKKTPEAEILNGEIFVLLCQYYGYMSLEHSKEYAINQMKKDFRELSNTTPLQVFITNLISTVIDLDYFWLV